MDLRRAMVAIALAAATGAPAANPYITVASTTSTENSGLFRHLLPRFTKKTGIEVRVVAQGTGQALDMGRRGDCDVVFVHNRDAELKMVQEGWFVGRRDVMYNDFVLVGPTSDPAAVKGMKDAVAAMKRIAAVPAPFASRGDRSGTHAAELRLWQSAGIAPDGAWYRETGSGMGATLNIASGMNAYALADRGSWLSFKNRGALAVLVESDARLFNQYGVMLVNPVKHAHVKKEDGQAFIDWLVSPEGQAAIGGYKIRGEALFFPNAKR